MALFKKEIELIPWRKHFDKITYTFTFNIIKRCLDIIITVAYIA